MYNERIVYMSSQFTLYFCGLTYNPTKLALTPKQLIRVIKKRYYNMLSIVLNKIHVFRFQAFSN